MERTSIWTKDLEVNTNDYLDHNEECDILIIGGGIAGLSTAFYLKDSNQKIILIDKEKTGFGVTSHTTGKLTYLQGDIYSKIEKAFDFEVAKLYLESQKQAINLVEDNIKQYRIECDYQKCDSYIFTTNEDKKLNNERDFLSRVDIQYNDTNKLPITFPCIDGLYVGDTAVFHPLKYLEGIKKVIQNNIKIYENTPAIDIDNDENIYIVKTPRGDIKTKKVIICTHYPFFIVPGFIPLKLHPEKSYALASFTKDVKDYSAINIDTPTYSIRYHQDYIIFGGFSHSLADKFDYKTEEEKLLNFYQSHFKDKINYTWQTHDLMTHDYLPMIGVLDEEKPNLLIATGFNKWGMTNGTIAGKVIADIILDNQNKFKNIFKPRRSLSLEKILNFIINNFKMGKTFVETKLNTDLSFYQNAYVTNIDGERCGVYVDENRNTHIVKNTCPHFKCNLIFNNADITWDCPCHGSRFDIDGNVIEGPSVCNIKIVK